MKTLAVTDTLDLSIPERIQLVEDIWDTIAVEADSVELTEEEKRSNFPGSKLLSIMKSKTNG